MAKVHWLLSGVIAILSLPAWGQTGLTGEYRDAFVGAAIRNCLVTQKGASENAAFSEQFLVAYCECYANHIADRVSRSELQSYQITKDHIPPEYQQKITAAGDVCIRATMKQFNLGTK